MTTDAGAAAADPDPSAPKVFVSYRSGDRNKPLALELATHLNHLGLEVKLDQLDEREVDRLGIPKYMERSIVWADKIVLIVDEDYLAASRSDRSSGVGKEVDYMRTHALKYARAPACLCCTLASLHS